MPPAPLCIALIRSEHVSPHPGQLPINIDSAIVSIVSIAVHNSYRDRTRFVERTDLTMGRNYTYANIGV